MLSYGTPAALAALLIEPRYLSARASASFWYSSGVSVTISTSSEMVWKVCEAVIAVNFALIDFAKWTACCAAASESGEPSVGTRMCLYMFIPLAYGLWMMGERTTTGLAIRERNGGLIAISQLPDTGPYWSAGQPRRAPQAGSSCGPASRTQHLQPR